MIRSTLCLGAFLVGAAIAYPRPYPQAPPPEGPLAFPRPGANGDYAAGDYFQYINVPAPATFEWGYRRGAPEHNREEYLSQKDHTFKAKLKWNDAYDGHGEHYYDYNHVGAPEPAYAPAAPAYGAPEPVYAPKPAYGPA